MATVPWHTALGLTGAADPLPALQQFPQGGFAYQDPMQGMGFLNRMQYLAQNNPEVLTSIGAGMMSGDLAGGFLNASKAANALRRQEIDKQFQNTRDNQTHAWLLDQGYSEADANAAMMNPEILNSLLKRRDYELQQEAQAKYDTSGAGNDYSGVLYWGEDEQGNAVPLSQNKSSGDLERADGLPMGTVKRFLGPGETASARASGKEEGVDVATLQSIESKLPVMRDTVKRMSDLAKKATYTPGGQVIDYGRRVLDMEARPGALAREKYQAEAAQVIYRTLRDTFGAQFTQVEGENLLATLGDPNKSPAEKQQWLDVFIQAKEDEVKSLKARTANAPYQRSDGGGGGEDPLGIR